MTHSALVLALGASVTVAVAQISIASDTAALDQGWGAAQQQTVYHMPQGSHMMPADLFAALEQPQGTDRFSDPDYLSTFGFIPAYGPSDLNPNAYPIGFAVESDKNQIGLTCGACHTANVEIKGETLRIDGAPSHLDFDSFYQALAQAVGSTVASSDRFERFAANFGATDEDSQTALRARLAAFAVTLTGDAVIRTPAIASGFGRVDAMTQIVNALAAADQSAPQNLYPVSAPVSYPPLWLTSELEAVQYMPIAYSPFARNGGQVLGVFGSANLSPEAGQDAFQSSMLVEQLKELEETIQLLQPPAWDETRMGKIDTTLRDQGAAIFADNCKSCHNMKPYARTEASDNIAGETFIKIGRVDFEEVGTDSAYVQNLLVRNVATNETTQSLVDGEPVVPAMLFFGRVVSATIQRAIADAGLSDEEALALNGMRFSKGEDGTPVPDTPPQPINYFKASPLAGVWATGPYLHNGSVPTIYELLSPVEERRSVFWTGGRELDLEHLGYVSSEDEGLFRFDTSLPGNGNGGHEYPATGLTENERLAVIEYLKSQ